MLCKGRRSSIRLRCVVIASLAREKEVEPLVRAWLFCQSRQRALLLPAEAGEFVGPFDVPLAEIAGVISGIGRPLRLPGMLRAQHCLVGVNRMLDKEHAVVVVQQPGHEAGARGRADSVARVGPASPINVPMLAGKGFSRFFILSAFWHICLERAKTHYAKGRTYPKDEGGLYWSKAFEHLTGSVYVGTIEAECVGNADANRA